VAAVVGREFEFALLQRAAGLDEEDVAGGVESSSDAASDST
jgi:hypothetical protein